MRIISGSARGRRLREPEGYAIRPTGDKIKESVFNIIQFHIEGRRVLDLFSGTGQLGIEALSRGAASVDFVDESLAAVRLTRENLKATGLEGRAAVVRANALSFIRRGGAYDVIFLDPPYDTGLIEKALAAIIEFDILKDNGIIICESEADRPLPDVAPPYFKGREYKYGKIRITLYGRSARAEG